MRPVMATRERLEALTSISQVTRLRMQDTRRILRKGIPVPQADATKQPPV